MTQTVAPSKAEIIPPTAPFSPEQRAWLNGYLAAVFSSEQTVTMLSAEGSAALMTGVVAAASDDDDAPWHDQTLALGDRMALAEGRPLRRRMMAAMAQQDCGQCGYDCAKYAEAIASRSEERLNLCVPGGKETARMLKQLYAELGAAGAKVSSNPIDTKLVAPETLVLGRSRDHPTAAHLASRRRLNASGSEKETWHVEFDLAHSGLEYSVGDSFGVYPANDPDLVGAVVRALQAAPDFPIGHRMLRDVLIADVSLGAAPDRLFQLFSYITGGDRRQKAKLLASGEDPDGDASSLDVLDAIGKFKGVRPDPEAFIEALDPLQPRLYSIASSIKMNPNTIALCVDAVRYRNGSRSRFGVASTFLAERLQPGERAKVYVQKAHNFGLPSDPTIPIIMIGPGTGIAPFRAFLQERAAIGAPGPNWLFFGHQRSGLDFFYKDELRDMKAKGSLARLSLAWSRDGDQKFYVQDRMREVGRDLWAWIADGAHIYVCGDAKRMAKDVERALVDIAAQFGVRSTDEAIAFVANLKKNGRYQQDVY